MSGLTLTMKKGVGKVVIEPREDVPILFLDPIDIRIVDVRGNFVRINIQASKKMNIRRVKE